MNICIVSPSFGYGGANIIAATLGKELDKTHNLVYYSYKYTDNYSNLPEEKTFFFKGTHNKILDKLKKSTEYIFSGGEFTPYKYYKREIEQLYELIERFNVECIILNSFTAVSIFTIPLRKKYPKVKQIAWMHESAEQSFGSLVKNYLRSYEKSLATVDRVVCLTQTDLKTYRQYNYNSVIIHNPVTFNTSEKSNLREKVISFTSRLDIEIKGLDYLVEVAKNIPNNWKIRVAANGREDQIEEFLRLIKKNSVENVIEYVGALKGEELIEHYVNSSIFISTSRIESFQLVLIEAMECGLPIISFKHSGAKEILDNGKYGILIENYKINEMSEEVNKLCNSYEERLKWQNISLKRVNDFNMDEIKEYWIQLLENLGVK